MKHLATRPILLLASLLLLAIISCRQTESGPKPPPVLVMGEWHAQLITPGGPLCFSLQLEKSDAGEIRAFIINEPERIEIPQVAQIGSTLVLNIDHYDSKLEATVSEDGTHLEGMWRKRLGADRWGYLRFIADSGQSRRFPARETSGEEDFDFEGRFRVRFASDKEDSIASFWPPSTDLWRGTFLTATGDYRYLAGNRDGNQLRLSCFAGAHAFLFHMTAKKDGTLTGHFWNWDTWHDTWTGGPDNKVELTDGFKRTKWLCTKTL